MPVIANPTHAAEEWLQEGGTLSLVLAVVIAIIAIWVAQYNHENWIHAGLWGFAGGAFVGFLISLA